MSFAYGILYLTLILYPISFIVTRGWSSVKGSLPFLGILAGIAIACGIIGIHSVYYIGKRYTDGHMLVPEDRLHPMIIGSVILPGGR